MMTSLEQQLLALTQTTRRRTKKRNSIRTWIRQGLIEAIKNCGNASEEMSDRERLPESTTPR
jgi:hypothetical protein